ncbi:MAG: hypothetical protein JWO89_1622 [Verrucomicrobiaceae bacterium]|nr:hypothetical protein [Verrucomicrobiaceae bacterium]MDB6117048.1 hypothetical protein [Verrucomicrobiaceae bacterium]
MLRAMIRLLLIASICLLAGCHALKNLMAHKPKKEEDTKEAKQLMVGTIELVNPEQRFVLIRTIAHLMLPVGTELFSRGPDGQTTKLKVTPERKGTFLAADIVSGSPQSQDTVLFQAPSSAPPALNGDKPVRGDITDMPLAPFPPYQPPATQPASSEFLRPIPPQPPLPTQPPQ